MFICTFSAASSPFESYLTRMQYSLMELQQTNSVGNYFTKARTITLSLMYLLFGKKSFNDAILILKYIYKLWYQLTNKNSQIAMVHFNPFPTLVKAYIKAQLSVFDIRAIFAVLLILEVLLVHLRKIKSWKFGFFFSWFLWSLVETSSPRMVSISWKKTLLFGIKSFFS